MSDLFGAPTISMYEWVEHDTWAFTHADGGSYELVHEPRLTCRSVSALLEAATAGVGVALMLEQLCRGELRSGHLVSLLPDWRSAEGSMYLVFTGARGLPPAVRALIDFLVEAFQREDLPEMAP
jgi:DNA-binding transcriptional LysR family regulator